MSTWWKINKRYSGSNITPYEVTSETKCFLTLAPRAGYFSSMGQRVSKDDYYPTFAAARTALMQRISIRADRLKEELEREREDFSRVFVMDEPT